MTSLLIRYEQGDCQNVWHDIHGIEDVTQLAKSDYCDVVDVIDVTTDRIRLNVITLYTWLLEAGYQFELPEFAYVPAHSESRNVADLLVDSVGAVPLLFRAWLTEVGLVCFRGKPRLESAHAPWREAMLDPLEILYSLDGTMEMLEDRSTSDLDFEFAADTYTKNGFGGGMPTHLTLPSATPDAWIREAPEQATRDGVWFVDYLREYFSSFGFRSTALSTARIDAFPQRPPSLLLI
ncbi:MAG TPA: hypothetical protein VK760_04565 [Candidatus Acidoferrales bacterium]|jgi:hypothetical protein|nr:hypothetical protein [Candidatus Acidoferrales bacterium]